MNRPEPLQPWAHQSYPIRVCSSAAGYYIGQLTRDGAPYSRLSDTYYRTRENANEALIFNTWPRKPNP
ncbi:MAG TPA: hypothetical protein EYN66_11920 [Myxococcales bacterium]|nr:hypothetical protein [Myxococcales bacterium]